LVRCTSIVFLPCFDGTCHSKYGCLISASIVRSAESARIFGQEHLSLARSSDLFSLALASRLDNFGRFYYCGEMNVVGKLLPFSSCDRCFIICSSRFF
jgi:hypothetical protein